MLGGFAGAVQVRIAAAVVGIGFELTQSPWGELRRPSVQEKCELRRLREIVGVYDVLESCWFDCAQEDDDDVAGGQCSNKGNWGYARARQS